ncbi:MAG: prolyl-tRNA synthetase associated domain-containing protein [Rhodospirillales bacterium]|nr:prolyl-tRNA synthetase associated domain-containing protein [Rhodospirillales bacterium]
MHKLADTQDPPLTPAQLLAQLDTLEITYNIYEHEPFFTVEEGLEFEKDIPGLHCRNLFLRDKKGSMFLITLANETAVDLKKLAPLIGAGRLSFGSPERLWRTLGVRPGSVCPFAIANNTGKDVTLILDQSMMDAHLVNYHPLINTMTVGLQPCDLIKFIETCGHTPIILDLKAATPNQD